MELNGDLIGESGNITFLDINSYFVKKIKIYSKYIKL
jgi:hypothetical protein